MLTNRGQSRGGARVCFGWIRFRLQPLATNLFPPPDYLHSHILECHQCSYISRCCLFLLYLSSTLLFLTPNPPPSSRWPWYLYPWMLLGLLWTPRWEQEMTQFLGHFCHSPNATQGGLTFSGGRCRGRQPPCTAVTPVVPTANTRSLRFTDRPFFFFCKPLCCIHRLLFFPWQYKFKERGRIKADKRIKKPL